MAITLRPYNNDTDLVRITELYNTANPEPTTPERVAEWESYAPQGTLRQYQVALDAQGAIVGYGDCWHYPSMLPDKFMVEIVIDPRVRRQGIGTILYRSAVEFAERKGATSLEVKVRDHEPKWRRFAESRGFVMDRHVFESVLELASLDEARFAGVIESVQARGIRFISLAQIGNTEGNRRRLYELNRRNALDIPGSDGTFPDFEQFTKMVFRASWFRAEGQILAVDGERWAGLTAIGFFPERNWSYNMFTGVEREYRGRQIALALKLLAAHFARGLGATYIRTNNDSENAPILAVNRKLGYVPQQGFYRMLQSIGQT